MLEYLVVTLTAIVADWSIYNASLVLLGLAARDKSPRAYSGVTFSLIVPAKNEGKVLGRLLERLAHQQYDKSSYEVIVVEDSSTDNTYEVCLEYSRKFDRIRCMKLPPSPVLNGKSRAVNEALKVAKGEIIGILDADSLPSLHMLSVVAGRFQKGAHAVQVKVVPYNVRESLVSRLASIEELMYEYSLIGRARLGLFVRLEGTGSFLRRDVLEALGGLNESILTEDAELAVRIYSLGMKVDYASDAVIMREVPPRFSWLVRQRLRWYRGNLELIRTTLRNRLTPWAVDSFLTLASPLVLSLYLPLTALGVLYPHLQALLYAWLLASVAGLMTFVATLLISKRHMVGMFFAVFTPVLMNVIAGLNFVAVMLEVFGAKKAWVKTERSGGL
jgi:cellulose synthase/poly-beta-1,6-N-acetylglucosamine synthase-like glycosyltransferase